MRGVKIRHAYYTHSKMAELDGAKGRLVEALKERTGRYWELMKNWYRRRIAKEEFDAKALGLLGDDNVHLHNEFLFAILVKCQTGLQPNTNSISGISDVSSSQQSSTVTPSPSLPPQIPPPPPPPVPPPLSSLSTSKPRPKRQRLISPPLEALPYGVLDLHQYHTPPKVQVVGRDLDTLLLCSHELLLPDKPTLHTRMLLLAWEAGLDGVSEDAASLLMLALEIQLKNVIQTLVAHMNTWQTGRNGHFQHSFGMSSSGCGLHSSSSPTHQEQMPECSYEQDRRDATVAMLASKSSSSALGGQPISLFHFRDALTLNRSSIPVHSVMACCMERALVGMWHQAEEEERQRHKVQQWQNNITSSHPPLTNFT